jgi:hypothetical protein
VLISTPAVWQYAMARESGDAKTGPAVHTAACPCRSKYRTEYAHREEQRYKAEKGSPKRAKTGFEETCSRARERHAMNGAVAPRACGGVVQVSYYSRFLVRRMISVRAAGTRAAGRTAAATPGKLRDGRHRPFSVVAVGAKPGRCSSPRIHRTAHVGIVFMRDGQTVRVRSGRDRALYATLRNGGKHGDGGRLRGQAPEDAAR